VCGLSKSATRRRFSCAAVIPARFMVGRQIPTAVDPLPDDFRDAIARSADMHTEVSQLGTQPERLVSAPDTFRPDNCPVWYSTVGQRISRFLDRILDIGFERCCSASYLTLSRRSRCSGWLTVPSIG